MEEKKELTLKEQALLDFEKEVVKKQLTNIIISFQERNKRKQYNKKRRLNRRIK